MGPNSLNVCVAGATQSDPWRGRGRQARASPSRRTGPTLDKHYRLRYLQAMTSKLVQTSIIARAVAVAAASLLFFGCSAQQELHLRADGSGTTELRMEVHEVLVLYLADLQGLFDVDPAETPVFNLEEIKEVFAANDALELVSAETPQNNVLQLQLSFTDVARIAAAQDGSNNDLISLEQNGQEQTLHIYLNPGTVRGLLALTPIHEVAEFLLPPRGEQMSRDEYVEYIVWALEEYESAAVLRRVVSEAAIELRVTVEGELTDQQGGQREGDVVVFQIPVVELLTIQEPLRYSLSYR